VYRFIVVCVCATLLSACGALTPPPKPAAQCPLPGQDRYAVIQLFFGRDIPGRGPLTDAEWDDFVAHVVSAQFPDGFTVLDGSGQWLDQATGRVIHEQSKVLLLIADPDSDLKTRIGTVTSAYRQQFHQNSVGVLTNEACAAF
jgi:hypothetical protein